MGAVSYPFTTVGELSPNYAREVQLFIDDWLSEAPFISAKTSGSTKPPERIFLSKESVRQSARRTGAYFGFRAGERLLLNLSPRHIAGKLMIVRAIEHRMELVVAPLRKDPLEGTDEQPIHFGAFVPSQIATILDRPESTEKLLRFKNVIIGGAPLLARTEDRLAGLLLAAHVTFGMTETVTHFALRRVGDPVYHCLEGYRCSVDERSCLVLHLPHADTAVVTNDMVELVASTSFKWLGRYDFVINCGGIKIHPEEVERQLDGLFPNNAFYATSSADKVEGEVVVLVVEGEVEVGGLLEKAAAILPRPYAPRAIYSVEQFPRTPSGKIVREKR